jgi:predicted DsbA family dithiol-disulfide isomerase
LIEVGLGADGPIAIDWLPFQLSPDVPPGGVPRTAFFAAKFGGHERAEAVWARVAAAGEPEGVRFAFDQIPLEPNTLDAHRAVRFSKTVGKADALIGVLFEAHFQRGQNIGDVATLAALGGEVGLDGSSLAKHLASDEDRPRHSLPRRRPGGWAFAEFLHTASAIGCSTPLRRRI